MAAELPGHGTRMGEPLLTDMNAVLDHLTANVGPYLERDFALVGHSMGALIAFELAHSLVSKAGRRLSHLVAVACSAPSAVDVEHLRGLSDQQLIATLTGEGGIDEQLAASEEFVELLIPILRADLEVAASYRYTPGRSLSVPIAAFTSPTDNLCKPQTAVGWERETTRGFQHQSIDGGHFLLETRREEFLRRVRAAFASV